MSFGAQNVLTHCVGLGLSLVLLLSASCEEPSQKWKDAECVPNDPDKPPCPGGTICLELDYKCHTLCSNEDSSLCPLEQACYTDDVCRDYEAECDGSSPCMGDFYCETSTHSCRKRSGLGAACSAADTCWSGICQDGYCCTSCAQSCVACSETLTGQPSGTCASILAGKKRGEDDCPDPLYCDGAGGCATKGPGEPCAAGLECTSSNCSPDGVCCDEACDASGCRACAEENTGVASGTCEDVLVGRNPFGECDGGLACNGSGECFGKTQSTQCSASYECLTGHCVDGYCCESACNELCEACRGDWTGAANGTCAPISSGTDPDTECGAATCTGDRNCSAPAPDGSPCGRNDQCASNYCVDGYCCGTECPEECEACRGDWTGAANGTCAPIPAFYDPEAECLAGDAAGCNGAGACKAAVKLSASDAQELDIFGSSVAIGGDYAIVGAPWEDGGAGSPLARAGAAYVFHRTGDAWDAGTRLVAPDAQVNDWFGVSVAISGAYVIVGARYEDGGNSNPRLDAGAAYVFRLTGVNTWDGGTKIVAPDAQAADRFGDSVAIDGEYAIVGARFEDGGDDDPLPTAGAAYVFRRTGVDTWDAGTRLEAPDAQEGDGFGASVAIGGEYAIVGAFFEDGGTGDPLADAGAAYVFRRTGSTWDAGTKLVAPDAQGGDWFGQSVALSGEYAIVGASGESGGSGDPLANAGAAYVFFRTASTWDTGTRLEAQDAQAGDRFGSSVAIDGDYAIVGARLEDGGAGDPAADAGAAYLFRRGADTWDAGIRIVAPDASGGDRFGESVAISAGDAIVGAGGEDGGSGDPTDSAGAAYVY